MQRYLYNIFYILIGMTVIIPVYAQTLLATDQPVIHGALSVQQAVQTGLRYNPGVQGMQADVRVALQETRAVRAMTKPQISANTTISTGSMSNIFNSSPGVTPVNTLVTPGKSYADQNLTLMVPLFTGGRLSSLVRAASERERAASANVGTEQAATALMIKNSYYRAQLASEMVKVAEARITADTELVRNAQSLFDAGKGIEAQVSRAQAELADAQRMYILAINDRAKMMFDLQTAMGVNPDSDFTLSDMLTYIPITGDVKNSLIEANKVRPELMAARARLAAARAQVSAAKGSLAPQVYGGVMADVFAPRDMNRNAGISAGITIGIPLFDAGQRRAEVAGLQAMQQRAEADLRSSELAVSNEIRQAWLDIQTAEQNYRTAQSALVAAQQAYDVTALRVQSQKSIQVELLDSITALTQSRTNVAQALYDYSIAIARLKRAVGKD